MNSDQEFGEHTTIYLRVLSGGMPGLSAAIGTAFAEAASVCLEESGHPNTIVVEVRGSRIKRFNLIRVPVSLQIRLTYFDADEATEFGACGIAIVLCSRLTGWQVIARSRKGTGFDYWLGTADQLPFQHKAKLEVSGIRSGALADVSRRVKEKLEQVERNSARGPLSPAFVAVIEFGRPLLWLEER